MHNYLKIWFLWITFWGEVLLPPSWFLVAGFLEPASLIPTACKNLLYGQISFVQTYTKAVWTLKKTFCVTLFLHHNQVSACTSNFSVGKGHLQRLKSESPVDWIWKRENGTLTKCQTVSLLIKKAGMILNIFQTKLLIKPFSEMDCKGILSVDTVVCLWYLFIERWGISIVPWQISYCFRHSLGPCLQWINFKPLQSSKDLPFFSCKTYLPAKSKNLLGSIQVALKAFWKVPDPNGWAGNPWTSRTQWRGPSVSMEPQSLVIVKDRITTSNSTTWRKKIMPVREW